MKKKLSKEQLVKQYKIKLLTQKLEEATGKKVDLLENEDIISKFVKTSRDPKGISKSIKVLKNNLSEEGWKLILQFMKTADPDGDNRRWIISKLGNLFSGSDGSISRSELRSYKNATLLGLLDTGDLQQIKTGVLIPTKSSSEVVKKAQNTKRYMPPRREKVEDREFYFTGMRLKEILQNAFIAGNTGEEFESFWKKFKSKL